MESKKMKKLAEKIAGMQIFDYDAYILKDTRIEWENHFIVFNQITLEINDYNFSEHEIKTLLNEIKAVYLKGASREEQKEISEAKALKQFIRKIGIKIFSVAKKERPDYVLTIDNKRIGIEITELTTPKASIVKKIVLNDSQMDMSEKDLALAIQKKYRKNSNGIEVKNLNGKNGVMAPTRNCTKRRELYAKQIETKYEKYKNDLNNFDAFIILCNAMDTFEIKEKAEAEEVIANLCNDIRESNVIVAILYEQNGKIKIDYNKKDS